MTALIGLGGAGKTSVAERLAQGAYVWSFYQDARVDGFMPALAEGRLGSSTPRLGWPPRRPGSSPTGWR